MAGPQLVDLGLQVARTGLLGAATLTGAGLAALAAGRRAYRPAAALVAAGGGALAVALVVDRWHPKLPTTPGLSLAIVAVALAALGLAFPNLALVVAASGYGLGAGLFAAQLFPAQADLALFVGAFGFCAATVLLREQLPLLVTPLVGGIATALGLWGAVGASGVSPALFRLPVVWLALAGVLTVAGLGLERLRYRSAQAGKAARTTNAEAAEKKKREDEARARYDRYMKM